jgi:hypothetical protein
MGASEKVRAWRERLREAGKVPVTLWLDAETKARLEDLAFRHRCSPSDLAQQALDAYRPGSHHISAMVTDTQQIRALIQQEFAQGTAALTASITATVTDIVTETITARLPALVEETVQAAMNKPVIKRVRIQSPEALPQERPIAHGLPITDTTTDTETDTAAPPGEPTAPHAQPLPVTDIVTDTKTDMATPPFDAAVFYLGPLCRKGHAHPGTLQSVRRIGKNDCVECEKARKQAHKARQRQAQPA